MKRFGFEASEDLLFEHGLDIANRRIFLTGEIDEKSAGRIIKSIAILSQQKKIIRLIINSDGGEIYHALCVYDVMRSCKCPIETIGLGQVMSAAVLLLAAGDKRYIGKNTYCMIHDLSLADYPETKLATFRKEIKHLNDLRQRFFTILAKHSKSTYKEWADRSADGADHYFSATTALEYGIADKLWPEK